MDEIDENDGCFLAVEDGQIRGAGYTPEQAFRHAMDCGYPDAEDNYALSPEIHRATCSMRSLVADLGVPTSVQHGRLADGRIGSPGELYAESADPNPSIVARIDVARRQLYGGGQWLDELSTELRNLTGVAEFGEGELAWLILGDEEATAKYPWIVAVLLKLVARKTYGVVSPSS